MNRLDRVISLGLAGVSVINPLLGGSTVAWAEGIDGSFEWVDCGSYRAGVVLSSGGWFVDSVSDLVRCSSGVVAEFVVEGDKELESISIIGGNGDVIDLGSEFRVSLVDIPDINGAMVNYVFSDGSFDCVPLLEYFGGVGGIVIDGEPPLFELDCIDRIAGVDVGGSVYNGRVVYTFNTSADCDGVANMWGGIGYRFGVVIDGVDYANGSGVLNVSYSNSGVVDFDINFDRLRKPLSGSVDIEFYALDEVGNCSRFVDSVFLDYVAPSVRGSITGDIPYWVSSSGVTYFRGTDEVVIEYSVEDVDGGIKSVDIYKDDRVFSSGVSSSGSFILSEEGSYRFRVEDGLGNSRVYSLGEVVSGLGDFVRFDEGEPVIVAGGTGIVGEWLSGGSVLEFGISDDIALDRVEYSLNGVSSVVDINGSADSYDLVIGSDSLRGIEGALEVVVNAYDVLGGVSTYRGNYIVDLDAPVIEDLSVSGDVIVSGSVGYISSPLVVGGSVVDGGSGVSSVVVYRGSEVVSDSLPYVISDSGVYSIEVRDYVGNVSVLSLSDITGLDIDSLVYDCTSPVISVSANGVDVIDDWYREDVELCIRAEDSELIRSVSYSINGREEVVCEVGSTDYELILNLDEYTDSKGLADIKFRVEDFAGNVSEYSHVFSIDLDAPEVSDGVLEGSYNVVDGVAYAGGSLSLDASLFDGESGIGSVRVLRDGVVVSDSLPYVISESGSYSLEVIDVAGNSFSSSVGDLVGLDISSIVIDGDIPVISASIGGSVVSSDWYRDSARLVLRVDDVSPVSAECSINGVSIECNSNEVIVDLENYIDSEGIARVEYVVVDSAGNRGTYSEVIRVDVSSPVLGDGVLDGDYRIYGDKLYISGGISLSASISDVGSGISLVEVIRDGVVVSDSLPYVIDGSGVYSVRVVDGVGHEVASSLGSLVGLGVSEVVFDGDSPVIDRVSGFEAEVIRDGVNWYSSIPNLELGISDSNLEFVSISVNGSEVISSISSSGSYVVPLGYSEGSYIIEVVAGDRAGNVSRDSYSFSVDCSNPVVSSGMLEGSYRDRGYGVYFVEEPVLRLGGTDAGIGVSEYVLLDGNYNEIGRNSTGVFSLGSGEYFVRVVDYFGRVSECVSVASLCGLSSNRFVIDGGSPVISCSRPEGDIDGWFNRIDLCYEAEIIDTVGVYSASLYVNGEVIDSFSAGSDGVSEVVLRADISSLYSGDGVYDVRVVAEDYSGLVSSWSDSIGIDTVAPSIVGADLLDEYVYTGEYALFRGNPNVNIKTSDSGIGVKRVILLDGDGVEVDSSDGFFSLDEGSYSVRVEDMLGNISDGVLLSDICGMPCNIIKIDSSKPVIECSRREGDYGNWFNTDVDYSISVGDEIGLSYVKVFINGVLVEDCTFGDYTTLSKDVSVSTRGIAGGSDGSYSVRVVSCDVAGNVSEWNDIIYIDRDAPVIDRFVISGKGVLEGDSISVSDSYGYYIDGSAEVEVHVSDGSYSSGLGRLYYTLASADGSVVEREAGIVNGVAYLSVPDGFKGYISAYAVDKVGNRGSVSRPSGIVSEGGNVHVNTSKVDLFLPKTDYVDGRGNNLYSGDVKVIAEIGDNVSGIRKVTWGVGDETRGTLSIDNSGVISGDAGVIVSKDKNLVIELRKDMLLGDNGNSLDVWVEVEDRVGHVSRNSRLLSIDRDAPVISVSYDSTVGSGFYSADRVAVVSVRDRNFRASDVKFGGTCGSVGDWIYAGDDVWVSRVVFSSDGDYEWSVDYTDMAGNVGNGYRSEKFTIDKTAPVISLSFDNNSPDSGNYFKDSRVASIIVKDRNFDFNSLKVDGTSIGSWSREGDISRGTIVFDKDGTYDFSVSCSDMAGNVSNSISSGKFIIDRTKPVIDVVGINNGVSYKKDVGFRVVVSDSNIDVSRSSVSLVGRSVGDIKLVGGISGTGGEFSYTGVLEDSKYDDFYTLKAVIYDKAGNVEERVINYSINRYGSKYSFVDEGLLNNIVAGVDDIVLEEVSVDRLDVASSRVVIIRDGQPFEVDSKYIKVEETGGTDSNWLYRYVISSEVFSGDGKYQVQLFSKALDGTDNSSLSQEYAFVLDSSMPEVIVSGISSGEVYRGVSRKVALEVRDLSGIASFRVLLNGKEVDLVNEGDIYSFVIPESSDRQSLYIEAVDRAGNVNSIEVSDFLVTSNVILAIFNSFIVRGLFGALGLFVLALLGVLFARRRVSKREEKELAREHARMYHDSAANSLGDSSSDE